MCIRDSGNRTTKINAENFNAFRSYNYPVLASAGIHIKYNNCLLYTSMDNIRYITPCPDYTLFYRHSLLKIEILVLWDNSHKAGKIKSIP